MTDNTEEKPKRAEWVQIDDGWYQLIDSSKNVLAAVSQKTRGTWEVYVESANDPEGVDKSRDRAMAIAEKMVAESRKAG